MVPTCVSPNETKTSIQMRIVHKGGRVESWSPGFLGCKRWGLGCWWNAMRGSCKKMTKNNHSCRLFVFFWEGGGGVKFKPLEDILHFWRTVINLSAEWIHSDHALEMTVSCFPADLWHGWSSSNGLWGPSSSLQLGSHKVTNVFSWNEWRGKEPTSYGTPNALVIHEYNWCYIYGIQWFLYHFAEKHLQQFYSVISNVIL